MSSILKLRASIENTDWPWTSFQSQRDLGSYPPGSHPPPGGGGAKAGGRKEGSPAFLEPSRQLSFAAPGGDLTACGHCPGLGAGVTWALLADTRVALPAHAPDTPYGNRSRDPSLNLILSTAGHVRATGPTSPPECGRAGLPPQFPPVPWSVPEGRFPVRVNPAPSASPLPPPSPPPGHPGSLCPRRTLIAPARPAQPPRPAPLPQGSWRPAARSPLRLPRPESLVLRSPRGHESLRCSPPPYGRRCSVGAR